MTPRWPFAKAPSSAGVGWHRAPRWRWWALVTAAHLLLGLWIARTPLVPRPAAVAPTGPTVVWLRTPAVPLPPSPAAKTQAPAPRQTRPMPAPAERSRQRDARAARVPAAVPEEPPPAPPSTEAAVAAAPSGASGAAPSLLDSEATRQAVRQAAKQVSVQERHALATEAPRPLSTEERLGQEVAKSAVGNCAKGEFAGGGMGLLSLPFFIAAQVNGKCQR